MRTALKAVIAMGTAASVLMGLALGPRAGVSTFVGACIAASNLYVLARILVALLTPPPGADAPSADDASAQPAAEDAATAAGDETRKSSALGWAFLALIKMTVLFGGIWLLMTRGLVSPLALLAGYGSLPVGIAVGSILSDRATSPRM